MQEILINIEAGERRVAILHSKRLEWYFVERVAEKKIVGNIYKGKVNSVLDGIGAAFVDCGLEKNGFLYISDIITPELEEETDFVSSQEPDTRQKKKDATDIKIGDIIKKDQDIIVQVEKEEIGAKGARLTTHISLPGRYLVLMPTMSRIGVSRKIKDEKERHRIKKILQELKLPEKIGVVARTAAEGCSKKEFLKDLSYLLDAYNRINREAKHKRAPTLLYEELDLSSKIIRDYLTEETHKVIVDDKLEFDRLKHFARRIAPILRNRLSFYQEQMPLFEKYSIEGEIDKLFERKIFLKCGGHITIEQTEGMVAIDVNSGKFTGKKSLEDTIFKVNCEAAEEITRQLRLRDIGGIVVIDFIDMESQQHRKEVFSILQRSLQKDKAKTNIISFSELNVVEMTRQRVRKSLESASYEDCLYCKGKGRVKSVATMVIVALRNLRAFLRMHRSSRSPVELVVCPAVAQRLVNKDAQSLDYLKKVFKKRISVTSDDNLHIEDVKVVTVPQH